MLRGSSLVGAPAAEHDGQFPPTAVARRRIPTKQLAENQVSFPSQPEARFKVLNPYSSFRVKWDCWLLLLILFVLVVTPFELSFISESKLDALFGANRLVDLFFVVDLTLEFNTAYFDERNGNWVLDRARIAKKYATSWLFVDVLAVLPYSAMPARRTGFLRLVKLVRLLKMLRALKNPRIMARIGKRITWRAGTQAIVKYALALFLIFHWSACCLKVIDDLIIQASECSSADITRGDNSDCPSIALSEFWQLGIWGQYVSAVGFAVATLNADQRGENVAENIFSIFVGVLGFITLAFLVGDLCNVITNLQPVRNDFRLTLDSLNDYLDEHHMPHDMRRKLREYMIFSETVFRENYYRGLLARLSPGLKLVVAHHNLSRVVTHLPFYQYAVHTTHPVIAGRTRVLVSFGRSSRRALVLAVSTDLHSFDVQYDDTGDVDKDVKADRVGLDDEPRRGWTEHHLSAMLHERDEFVVSIAGMLETQLFMPRDTIVHCGLSLNTHMFVVHSGRCLVFGRNSARDILASIEVKTIDDVIGDDICMLTVGRRRPVTRHYSAVVCALTQVHVLAGKRFVGVVHSGSYPVFGRHVRVYGAYQHIKRSAIMRARNKAPVPTIPPSPVKQRYDWGDDDDPYDRKPASVVPFRTGKLAARARRLALLQRRDDDDDDIYWSSGDTTLVESESNNHVTAQIFPSDDGGDDEDATPRIQRLAFFFVHGILAKPESERRAFLADHPAIAGLLRDLDDEIRAEAPEAAGGLARTPSLPLFYPAFPADHPDAV